MDESRKQFEEWWEGWFGESPVTGWWFIRLKGGGYSAERINDMWEAWQASRTSIEINLPKACAGDEYFIDGVFQPMRYERDAERAIFALGLKIKGD